MSKQIINTPLAPAPIGPYSQAILNRDMLYTSGQIAIDPDTSSLIQGTVQDETVQVMENLKAVLHAAGMTFENVLKTSIFIADMNDFSLINEVYSRYIDDATAPARETVEVANLPKFVKVEISMIASL